jgi:hypothetical protein
MLKSDFPHLFNIKDLPTLKFKDSAYELLIQERNNVHEYLGTIFYINLYVNNDVKNEAVMLDEFGCLTIFYFANYNVRLFFVLK